MFPYEVTMTNRKNYRKVPGKYQLVFENEIKKENLETKNLGKLRGRINRDFPAGWKVFTESLPNANKDKVITVTTQSVLQKPKAVKVTPKVIEKVKEVTPENELLKEFKTLYPNEIPSRDTLRSEQPSLCNKIVKEYGSYTTFKQECLK